MSAADQANEARTMRLSVLVNEAEAALIAEHARAAGQTVSGFLRNQALMIGGLTPARAALRAKVEEHEERLARLEAKLAMPLAED